MRELLLMSMRWRERNELLKYFSSINFPGSTETSSDKVELSCGGGGVFATAKLLGINIKVVINN